MKRNFIKIIGILLLLCVTDFANAQITEGQNEKCLKGQNKLNQIIHFLDSVGPNHYYYKNYQKIINEINEQKKLKSNSKVKRHWKYFSSLLNKTKPSKKEIKITRADYDKLLNILEWANQEIYLLRCDSLLGEIGILKQKSANLKISKLLFDSSKNYQKSKEVFQSKYDSLAVAYQDLLNERGKLSDEKYSNYAELIPNSDTLEIYLSKLDRKLTKEELKHLQRAIIYIQNAPNTYEDNILYDFYEIEGIYWKIYNELDFTPICYQICTNWKNQLKSNVNYYFEKCGNKETPAFKKWFVSESKKIKRQLLNTLKLYIKRNS